MAHLKVGVIGCGHISAAHLRGWQKTPSCNVVGVLDLDRALAAKRARQFGITKIYEDIQALIGECDIVDVCTPPQSHFAIARQVIAAGRHLVIEKPLVTDLSDWEALKVAAEQSPATLTVIHNLKFSRAVQAARRWVDAGRIGKVFGLTREFLTHEDADRMLVADNHWSHSLPGGRWFETLPHELYLTHYFLGPLELDAVTAVRSPMANAAVSADEVLIALAGKDAIATIRFSANARINKRVLTLHGAEGEIHVDVLGDSAVLSRPRDEKWRRAVGGAYLNAAQTLTRAVTERMTYAVARLRGESPHVRILRAVEAHLAGTGPEPTPLEEIDYVIRSGDRIGRAIDRAAGAGHVGG